MTISKFIVFCVLVLFSSFATAASTADAYHVLDQIQATYQPLQLKWHDLILPFAYSLFWKLVLLDVCWSAIKMVMERREFGEMLTWLMQKAFSVGFFFTIMKLSGEWIPQILNSFALIGKTASGVKDITPDGILSIGIDLGTNLIISIGKLGIFQQVGLGLFVIFVALFVMVCFILIAGQLLIALIESYIVVGGGIIMMGFSGSKWTVEMATAYLKYAVGAGAKIMIAYLIVGGGIAIFNTLSIDTDHLIKSLLALFAEAGIFAYLALQIPSITAAMVSGSPSSSFGGVMAAATGVAGAMVGAASATANAGISTAGSAYNAGSKASSMGSNLMGGRGNSLESVGGSNNGSSVPDPTGPSPSSKNDGRSVSVSNDLNKGDASKASIGSSAADSRVKQFFDDHAEKSKGAPPLHQKIKNAGNVLPSDQANIQVSGISMGHGKE